MNLHIYELEALIGKMSSMKVVSLLVMNAVVLEIFYFSSIAEFDCCRPILPGFRATDCQFLTIYKTNILYMIQSRFDAPNLTV